MSKVDRIIRSIKVLSVAELQELTKKLGEMGIPPKAGAGVAANPKPSPPSLSATERRRPPRGRERK